MCNASILDFYASFQTWYTSRYDTQQKGSLGHRACANRRPAAMNQGDASRCFVLDVLDLEVFHGWVCLDVTFLGGSILEDERWLPKSFSYWKMKWVHTTCSGVVTLWRAKLVEMDWIFWNWSVSPHVGCSLLHSCLTCARLDSWLRQWDFWKGLIQIRPKMSQLERSERSKDF